MGGYIKKMKRVPTGGFERVKVGDLMKGKRGEYKLRNKFRISFHKCPSCGSKVTFHSERLKTLEAEFQKTGKAYENTFDRSFESANSQILIKKDLCLKCGKTWACEMFCWERLNGELLQYFDFKTGKIYLKEVNQNAITKSKT